MAQDAGAEPGERPGLDNYLGISSGGQEQPLTDLGRDKEGGLRISAMGL